MNKHKKKSGKQRKMVKSGLVTTPNSQGYIYFLKIVLSYINSLVTYQ